MKVLFKHWKKFVNDDDIDKNINSLIAKSWIMSKNNNIDYTGLSPYRKYSQEQLSNEVLRNRSVTDIIESYVEVFYNNIAEDAKMTLSFLDKECYIIKQWHREGFGDKVKALGLYVGICWHHDVMGTSGPGLANYLDKPIIIEEYEHYIQVHHSITQMSTPIHDVKGNIIGVIDATMPAEETIISFYRTLIMMAHGIERELRNINYIDIDKVRFSSDEVAINSIEHLPINNKYQGLVEGYTNRQQFLNEVFEQPYIGMVYYSHPEKIIIDANKRYIDIIKDILKTDKIIGLTFDDYAKDWIDKERATKFWDERLSTGQGGTLTEFCIPKDNKNYYYNANVKPLKRNGFIVGWLETISDVTEIKMAKKQFEERERFITDIFDAFDVPVTVFSYPDLTIKFINERFNKFISDIVGRPMTKKEIEGKALEEYSSLYKHTRLIETIHSMVFEKKSLHIEQSEFLLNNGESKVLKIAITPMLDVKGNVESIIAVGMDITEEIEFMKHKDEFFSIISHELRSPTNIIISASQLLLMDKYKEEISDNLVKHIQRIRQNSYKLLRLINNFLDIQKSEAGYLDIHLSNVDFVQLAEEITNSVVGLAESKGIKVIFDTVVEEKVIAIDVDKFERILLNILANATKFTGEGGEILVTISEIQDFVKLSVKDNGIGISNEKLDKIFDKFIMVDSSLSRRSEGTGLGLALTKLMVSKMGGKIEAISEEGKGTEFIVYFPEQKLEDNGKIEPVKSLKELEHIISIEFSDIYYI